MDTSKPVVRETLYVQKWPEAKTVAETQGVEPEEVLVLHTRTEQDGPTEVVEFETVTPRDPRFDAVNRRAEAEKRKVNS